MPTEEARERGRERGAVVTTATAASAAAATTPAPPPDRAAGGPEGAIPVEPLDERVVSWIWAAGAALCAVSYAVERAFPAAGTGEGLWIAFAPFVPLAAWAAARRAAGASVLTLSASDNKRAKQD